MASGTKRENRKTARWGGSGQYPHEKIVKSCDHEHDREREREGEK